MEDNGVASASQPEVTSPDVSLAVDRTMSAAKAPAAATQDAPVCRICRFEEDDENPLFYPCKCTGSIKFVHQGCLMEWLSHSQKKYCELCKTPFRFTKLYSPDMPQSLPLHVFVEHMARYLIRNLLVWLRAAVAISVWVCWLPYFMRSVWSFMFWVSDEGFGTTAMLGQINDTSGAGGTIELSSTVLGMDTCPASPLFAPITTSAAAAETMLSGLSGQTTSEFFVRLLLGALGIPPRFDHVASSVDAVTNITSPEDAVFVASGSKSLLGDVGVLRNLTRSATVNRTVITVLEGQIITILVIVCFILVILVRDYVVQQQPEINMRGAFDAPEEQHHPLPQEPEPEPVQVRQEVPEQPAEQHGIVPTSFHIERDDEGGVVEDGPAAPDDSTHSDGNRETTESNDAPLNEQPNDGPDHAGPHMEASVIEYLRIYRRAGGDANRILAIIEEEQLEERLQYWVDITRRSLQAPRTDAVPHWQAARHLDTDQHLNSESGEPSSSSAAFTPTSSGQSQAGDSNPDASREASSKGKERVWLPTPPESALSAGPDPDLSRPRSQSEGPLTPNRPNPLASNTWSFEGLQQDSGQEEDQRLSRETTSPAPYKPGVPSSTDGEPGSPEETTGPPENLVALNENNASPFGTEAAADVQLVVPHTVDEEPAADGVEQPATLVGRVTNFMWGNLEDQQHVNGHDDILENGDNDDVDDDDWIDVPDHDHGNRIADPGLHAQDVDADAAGEDPEVIDEEGGPLDPEAMEDLEDFEGVMELIGMRGPLAGLFQNAIFCAVLVSVTIFTCIFFPYNIGRIIIWLLAHPMRLARMLFELSKLIQDAAILFAGLGSWALLNFVDIVTGVIGGSIGSQVVMMRKASWALWTGAGARVLEYMSMGFPMSASEMQNFSAVSHDALLTMKSNIGIMLGTIKHKLDLLVTSETSLQAIANFTEAAVDGAKGVSIFLTNPGSWIIDFSEPEQASVVNGELAYWPGVDRFWAISAGYVAIFLLAALYVKRGNQFARGTMMGAWEAGAIDTMHQASGVMKVILIIGIEMLVFPLYCGLLLDVALLPLFEGATLKSRTLFSLNYPLTSAFVHWFVGTGYMFHFALFVSMCRKIMRPGVLYFIRDPDDPEFHPVRDVLERNLTTQLRKILFSAFVYGALVIICLGGVVWGLAYTPPNVLPIHYSSNEPVLEFPVDLLFYNFLMPLAVKFFKPSDGLQKMYTWWFRRCARWLRLTYFLFGDRRIDEEGILRLAEDSEHKSLPKYRTLLLAYDTNTKRVVPMNIQGALDSNRLDGIELPPLRRKKNRLVETGQLVKNGRFVRAPASDRIKIPKGQKVFMTVDERNHREDGKADDDLYASSQYQKVYIPPHFRTRVFLFILFIWGFAAITGVGFTIVPLVFGRKIFELFIPEYIRTNDIYAFSIGVYILGSATYCLSHSRRLWDKVKAWGESARDLFANGQGKAEVAAVCTYGARLSYAYVFILVVFPLLVSTIMELYLVIPMHNYMHKPSIAAVEAGHSGDDHPSRHTVRVIQAWTLGLLYLKLGTKTATTIFGDTRFAAAVRAVLRRGWLDPDIQVLTRAFVIPGLAMSALAVFVPPAVTTFLITNGMLGDGSLDAAKKVVIYRLSYVVFALFGLLVRNSWTMIGVCRTWTARIRDEAYLIGERLHNFGAATAGPRKGRQPWRTGSGRL